ncbi:GNAT family N-acetyltransferase [Metabacillus idriensis]|uniref:GNAT family N-acetyltransferase n=1 Tax=Metabacillus idriensis TaxID=324768 RepID=A0A6I2M9C0_9BACI|nr:GNAT family N-acetyltransferase [Metabacillus idriensis]MCM3595854.1 GNAT family N-acetyltransferase [Metabacillus idriensis]MRX53964.1 GNAT family N-acetyltransferase [Metabacillus idriensis]
MIKHLNHRDYSTAEKILGIQIPAYLIEAEIIGFRDIPQLKETPKDIAASTETFIGCMLENDIRGVLSYERGEEALNICRLVVHPGFFRLGMASTLLDYLLKKNLNKRVTVSTGSKNFPAIALYQSFGFEKTKEIEVAPGVRITLLQNGRTD